MAHQEGGKAWASCRISSCLSSISCTKYIIPASSGVRPITENSTVSTTTMMSKLYIIITASR